MPANGRRDLIRLLKVKLRCLPGVRLGVVEGRCVLIFWGCIVKTGCVGDNIVWNVTVRTVVTLRCCGYDQSVLWSSCVEVVCCDVVCVPLHSANGKLFVAMLFVCHCTLLMGSCFVEQLCRSCLLRCCLCATTLC